MRKFVIMAVFFTGLSDSAIATEKLTCTRADAIAAEDEASTLKNWNEVYKSFRKFSRCDDGAIAEGYSDAIARLLTDNWETISKLNSLTSRDKNFERFVLHHIDELMALEQAKKLYTNVQAHCPMNEKILCKKIENALNEMTSHIHICPPYGKATCIPGQE